MASDSSWKKDMMSLFAIIQNTVASSVPFYCSSDNCSLASASRYCEELVIVLQVVNRRRLLFKPEDLAEFDLPDFAYYIYLG
jgi:hypothetical protein